ncbi:PEP-CTERM sorting domain-containing protein [Kiritimatiellota bacterium B12222]|nr:PEP-CTERM sorting domain-containing protein [Kiritimatiellota bacterium B12222]
MMKIKSFVVTTFAAFCLLTIAHASPVTGFSDITTWVGSGSNQAGFVIDFNDGSTNETFAWGYRWDGVQTSEDMFRAITAYDVNLSGTAPGTGSGFYVNSITYIENAITHTSDNGAIGGTADEWWTYYTAEGSTSIPGSWTESAIGAGDRTLANNSWDGWSATIDNNYPSPAPGAAINAIPEPTSILLLVAGLGMFVWLRRASSRA